MNGLTANGWSCDFLITRARITSEY